MSNPRWPNDRIRRGLVALGVLALTSTSAPAMSGTSQVAWPGKPVAAQPDWPDSVLDPSTTRSGPKDGIPGSLSGPTT